MINDLKYEIKDGKLVNKVSGKEIPDARTYLGLLKCLIEEDIKRYEGEKK